MKPILFTVLIAFAAACGGSDTAGDTTNTKKVQIDPEKVTTSENTQVSCSEEHSLDCEEGSVDGCGVSNDAGVSLTLSHMCVPESETFAAAGCEQEIARECGDGLVDACLLSPAASTLHVCVAQPAALDEDVVDPDEPDYDESDDLDYDESDESDERDDSE